MGDLATPASLYMFGPTGPLWVGKQIESPERVQPDEPVWRFTGRPTLAHWMYGMSGGPRVQRIWRLVPNDQTSPRRTSWADVWECRSATIVEEISPATVMPAWDDFVTLCDRLFALTDSEVQRLARELGDGDPRVKSSSVASVARVWAAWSVGYAARQTPSTRTIISSVRAGGSWYEEMVDPAWLRVEAAAIVLAEGIEHGTATLEVEGALFGPWASRDLVVSRTFPHPVPTDG